MGKHWVKMDTQITATTSAPAKVNLFLEVVGRRDDGYHDIVSVFQEIDLVDCLSASLDESGAVTVRCNDPLVPCDETNIIVKAVKTLQEMVGVRQGMKFHLDKHIPVGSGLGGGSSNAAAALKLANRLLKLKLSREELAQIGSRVGSDVPFFFYGRTCLCEGRGERITPLHGVPEMQLALVSPPWGNSTATVYGKLAGQTLGTHAIEPFIEALLSGDKDDIAQQSYNRFEKTVFEMEPRQLDLYHKLSAINPRAARMSGTGSSMWCLLRTEQSPWILADQLKDSGYQCRIAEVQSVV